jgi:membrane protein YqaA with SNARE-associated domain
VLPLSSEAALATVAIATGGDAALLLTTATVANTLGSSTNWLLGRWFLRFQDRRWFPVKAASMAKAGRWFDRYGKWSLLLAWLPIVGDPLTVVAGVMRVAFLPFVVLVGVGKLARYAAVLALAQGLAG